MFTDNYIVVHDLHDLNPIVIKIDSIKAIVKSYYDEQEHSVIHINNMIFSVSETMEIILRRLQKGER